jgi:tetratricopeptide (TPR) repeat protein
MLSAKWRRLLLRSAQLCCGIVFVFLLGKLFSSKLGTGASPGEGPVFFSCAQPRDFTDETFTNELSRSLTPAEVALVVNPVTSSDEMKRWAIELTRGATNDQQRAEMLFDALLARANTNEQHFPKPPTAREAFEQWNNPAVSFGCQDFAFLYVASARALGLKSYHVFVGEDCNGVTLLHGCASVFIGRKALLVDPAYLRFGIPHRKFQLLDDLQTSAIYLSAKGNLSLCQIACKLAPALSLVRAGLFEMLAREERWEEARAELRKLSEMDPTGPLTYCSQAEMEMRTGDIDRALESARKAVLKAPQTSLGHLILGVILMQKGNFSEAESSFQNTLRYSPYESAAENARKYIALANAQLTHQSGYALGTNGDWEGAMVKFSEAVSFKPDYGEGYLARGAANQHLGNWEQSSADYDKGIQLRPDLAYGYFGRGTTRYSGGDLDGALVDYKKASELDSTMVSALRMLGFVHYDRHEFSDALNNLRKACASVPNDDYARFRVWLTRSRLGERADATRELQAYLKDREELVEKWPSKIGGFLIGNVSELDLLRSAQDKDTQQETVRSCEAHYYIGCQYLIVGDLPAAATNFDKCVATGDRSVNERASAMAELRLLRKSN